MISRFLHYSKSHPVSTNLAILLISLLLIYSPAEFILRYTGRHASFNEQYGLEYNSVYNVDESNWYHIYKPHEVTTQTLKEYAYSIRANNEGLLDKDFSTEKTPGTIRIMVIGDSFIQGMGTSADSTCPKQLEAVLNQRFAGNPPIEVWNCGVGGSDPFFEWILLKDKLLKYKPDFVIEAVNNTDLTDVFRRGGAGRFHADSTVSYRHGPWFEPLYQRSFVFRAILHDILGYNWIFLTPSQEARAHQESIALIDSALTGFYTLCAAHHIPLLVSVQPCRYDFPPGPPYIMGGIVRFCDSSHIPVIDALDHLVRAGWDRDKAAQLYWPLDGHFNTLGYHLYAQYLSRPLIDYIAAHKDTAETKLNH